MKRNNPAAGSTPGSWSDFKKGAIKLRTWTVDSGTGKRRMSFQGVEDIRNRRSEILKDMRSGQLKLSQSELARAIHVSVRTLQGWEIGRSFVPEPVMVLLELMRDLPAVRQRLMHA